MTYKNTKTGNIICVKSEIKGQFWECVDSPKAEPVNTDEKPKRKATRKNG